MRVVSEQEFQRSLILKLCTLTVRPECVTGKGRSGAIAAAYISHILGIPFLPFGTECPNKFTRILIADTAIQSGRTLRSAVRKYSRCCVSTLAVFHEPPRVKFWYENTNS